MNIGDKIVKFPDNCDGLYLGKPDKNCFSKLAEEKKRKTVEELKHCKPWVKKNKCFSERQYKRSSVARKIYHMVGAPT